MLPPLVPASSAPVLANEICAWAIMEQVRSDIAKAKDNLMLAKISQGWHADKHRSADAPFKIGDKVMLSTKHCHAEFSKKGEKHVVKFFPHFNGPYRIIKAHPETSNYTLDLPESLGSFPTFHSSLLK
jgi:hypothetical protein